MLRILHFSDTHLFADPGRVSYGVQPDATLRAVLAAARQRETACSGAVVTGDLVHDEAAAYGRLRQHFAGLGLPVHCLPGNHDVPAEMRTQLAEAPVSWRRSVQYGAWRLIFLDSTVPGEVGGHLDTAELDAMDRLLGAPDVEHAVVCLHHPPRPCGSAWLDRRLNLDNPQDFFAVLDAHSNVRAVLWGHIHQEYDELRRGVRLLGTPSTMAQFRPD
ncbi:MAG: phosphodiesterase, partial [Gammaproteobacteria bacterium]